LLSREQRGVLDEEIGRLPKTYREAFVLCHLEGKTNEEAARLLGCPLGTVLSRLARARARLRARLSWRGLTPGAGVSAALLAQDAAQAVVPAELAARTAQTAATGIISANVVSLAEGVSRAMLRTRIAFGAALLLFVAFAGGGITLFARHLLASETPAVDGPAARSGADLPRKAVKPDTQPPADADPQVREAIRELLTIKDFAKLWQFPGKWRRALPGLTRKQFPLALLQGLRSAKGLNLDNYADLFIPSRVRSGKMAFHGHGLMVEQDLFLEGGRCAWAIEELLGIRLPLFTEELFRDRRALEEQFRESHRLVIEALRRP
jgi:hypothetical protein